MKGLPHSFVLRSISFSFLGFFACANAVLAVPTITSFVVSPTAVNSGQLISLSWSGQETSGYSLMASCVPGVKIKNQDGSLFACGVKNTTSLQSSDSVGMFLINTSGTQKSVTWSLYPKSAAGDEYASSVQQSISVAAAPYPLSGVYSSATSTVSASATSITWSSLDLDGVNLMLSCADGVSATSSSSVLPDTLLPCGKIAFDNKLSGSGSVTLQFRNRNADRAQVTATILPYIADGTYDLTHAQTIFFDVASDQRLPSQILSFISSPPQVSSDDTATLIWTSRYTDGVNIQMDCTDSLSAALVTSTTTVPILCNQFIFPTALGGNASTSIVFSNTSTQMKTASLTLFPQIGRGYDGTNIRRLFISVSPKGQSAAIVPVAAVASTTVQISSSPTVSSQVYPQSQKNVFTKTLSLGSKNNDVTLLQQFLSRDSALYPEAQVSGYFGPATLRAIQRFQIRYGITTKNSMGYGIVGPATRAKLNSL